MEFGKAVIHYKNAIEIDSGFTAAKASLGNILFEKFDREKGREWLDQAILSIDDLTDYEKYSILSLYAVNIENNLDKGIEYLKTIIELYPDDPTSYHNLGWYYQQQGLYEKAVEEYKTGLRIDPYMMLSYGGLIWSYIGNLGRMDSALVWSEKMIEAGPENPWGYFYLGSVYVGLDNLERAEIEYAKARDLDPNLLINLYRSAHVYRLLEKYDKAIEALESILDKNPKEVSAHYDLGVNYSLLGDRENSRNQFLEFKQTFKEYLDDNPDNLGVLIAYGVVLTRLGEKDSGWEIGKRAIEIDPTSHFRFAELLAAQNKKSEALDQLEKALENGYRDLTWIKLNPEINLLHEEVRYQELINKYFN